MSLLINPYLSSIADSGIVVKNVTTFSSDSNATTYDITVTLFLNRVVVVGVGASDTGGGNVPSSIVIDPAGDNISMTEAVSTTTGSTDVSTAIYRYNNTTLSGSKTIRVTYPDGADVGAQAIVWQCAGMAPTENEVGVDGHFDADVTFNETINDAETLPITSGDFYFWIACRDSSLTVVSFEGSAGEGVKSYENVNGNNLVFAAGYTPYSSVTGDSIDFSWSATGSGSGNFCVAGFQPL